MRQFTQQDIQNQFDRLPPEVQNAINSSELPTHIKAIAQKFGLHTDQLGEFADEIGLVVLGLRRSSDFIGDLMERLSISSKDAGAIAQEANTLIFASIRSHLQNMERQVKDPEDMDRSAQDISKIERAGNFSVDRPKNEAPIDVTHADKPTILNHIENPQPTPPTPYKPIDPLIDHLLTTPTSSVVGATKINDVPTKPAQIVPPTPPKPSIDTYREPIA